MASQSLPNPTKSIHPRSESPSAGQGPALAARHELQLLPRGGAEEHGEVPDDQLHRLANP